MSQGGSSWYPRPQGAVGTRPCLCCRGKAALPQGVRAPTLRVRWDWVKSGGVGWDGLG